MKKEKNTSNNRSDPQGKHHHDYSGEEPKRFKTAYLYYSQDRFEAVKKQLEAEKGKSVMAPDVSTYLGMEWRKLPDQYKLKWIELANLDKERYRQEKEIFGKRARDPTKPRRPTSAYLSFANEHREEMSREHPDASNGEISKLLSIMWKTTIDSATKEKYEQTAAKRRKDYKVAMGKWQQEDRVRKAMQRPSPQSPVRDTKRARTTESIALEPNFAATGQPDSAGMLSRYPRSNAANVSWDFSVATTPFPVNDHTQWAKPQQDSKRMQQVLERDEIKPKRPQNSYICFANERRKEVKRCNPGVSNGEVSKLLSGMWKGLGPETKDRYKQQAKMRKESYDAQMTEFNASQAFTKEHFHTGPPSSLVTDPPQSISVVSTKQIDSMSNPALAVDTSNSTKDHRNSEEHPGQYFVSAPQESHPRDLLLQRVSALNKPDVPPVPLITQSLGNDLSTQHLLGLGSPATTVPMTYPISGVPPLFIFPQVLSGASYSVLNLGASTQPVQYLLSGTPNRLVLPTGDTSVLPPQLSQNGLSALVPPTTPSSTDPHALSYYSSPTPVTTTTVSVPLPETTTARPTSAAADTSNAARAGALALLDLCSGKRMSQDTL